MNSIANPDKEKTAHPVFTGMNDRQVAELYQQQRIIQLQPDQCLFSEGDADINTYLILKGELPIFQSWQDTSNLITIIENPGLISNSMFIQNGLRTATARALHPAIVLAIDDSTLNALGQDLQLLLFHNLARELAKQMNFLISGQAEKVQKTEKLSRQVEKILMGKSSLYDGSSALQKLLDRVPKLPPYASQLTVLLLNEEVSTRDVTNLAKLDPSLTGAVLKNINSAYYGLRQKVTDFQHATLLLGFNQVYQIIIKLGIQKTMPDNGQFKRLQSHSVSISILCYEICQIADLNNAQIMNTIGLLHDIGKSVLLLLISQNPKLAFFIGLLDPAQTGAQLLKSWDIPDELCSAIEYQKFPEFLPPESIPEHCRNKVAVLYLAHLCLEHLSDNKQPATADTHLPKYLKTLGIKEQNLPDFIDKKLMKSVKKRLPTYPQEVQDLFIEDIPPEDET